MGCLLWLRLLLGRSDYKFVLGNGSDIKKCSLSSRIYADTVGFSVRDTVRKSVIFFIWVEILI